MNSYFYTVHLNSIEFKFLFNAHHHPVIEVKGQPYTSLMDLFRDFPILTHPSHREKSAQMINFLIKGLDFQYIHNIENFKEAYQKQVEVEQESLMNPSFNLTQYGRFDVSVMHPPKLEKGKLIFFVKNEHDQLPYQVSLPFPVHSDKFYIHYQLLPFAQN